MSQFRGKRKDNGEWAEGYFFQIWERTYILWGTTDIPNIIEVIPKSVGQATGLKDKNGKEIYGEGDIYKDANGTISVVKMAVDGWALFPTKKGTPVRNLYWHNVCDKTKGEIIGNVHDNPELLEVKQ